jgi:Flp pilus assembly protein TadG
MLRKLARDGSGMALMEFAIVLPVMVLMYLGAYTVSDMVACNRKVTIAATTLANLASHALSPTSVLGAPSTTSATTYLSAGALVLSPYPMSGGTETITLLRVCSTTQAYVVWSQSQTQDNAGTVAASPITAGSPASPTLVTLPSGLLTTLSGSGSYYPLAPTSSTSSTTNNDICANTPASGNTPVVGQAGAYLFVGKVSYAYTPAISYKAITTTQMATAIYMSPRLN